jgi:hypothetical protein
MANEKLNSGITAYKAGNKVAAKKIFSEIVTEEPKNETAWLWLAASVEEVQQKRYCLRKALAINPSNQNIRKVLEQLEPLPEPTLEELSSLHQSKPDSTFDGLTSAKPDTNARNEQNSLRNIPENQKSEQFTIPSKPSIDIQEKKITRDRKGRKSFVPWIILSLVSVILITVIIFIAFFKNTPSTSQNPPIPLATSTQKSSTSCKTLTQSYIGNILPLMDEYGKAFELASSTPRISLGNPIENMQRIRQEVSTISAPECVNQARNLILQGMDGINNSQIKYANFESESVFDQDMAQGFLDIHNGTAQLTALASGQISPSPQILPSNTPFPTAHPTATALAAGESFVINDSDGNPWQIRVTNVLTADTLSSPSDHSTEKAAGRFAILFLEVTNRGLSPDTFVAYGFLDVKDATGHVSRENPIAFLYAMDIYGTDLCAAINPDESNNCVAVYDVSTQSDFYLLVPGLLVDPSGPKIRIEIP